MRKRTVRNGLRLVLASLILIILASFYHLQLSDLFLLTPAAEDRIYSLGMFWAAAIGGYGVVLTVFGFAQSSPRNEVQVRLLPIVLGISALIFLFFYLFSTSMDATPGDEQRRLRPGETITI